MKYWKRHPIIREIYLTFLFYALNFRQQINNRIWSRLDNLISARIPASSSFEIPLRLALCTPLKLQWCLLCWNMYKFKLIVWRFKSWAYKSNFRRVLIVPIWLELTLWRLNHSCFTFMGRKLFIFLSVHSFFQLVSAKIWKNINTINDFINLFMSY